MALPLIPIALAAAAVAFLASKGGSPVAVPGAGPAPKGAPPVPAVQDELKKLYAANPTAYNAVTQLLGGGNPAVLIQYAAQLMNEYPNLAKTLGDMAAGEVTPSTGASGTTWNLWGRSEANAAGGGVPSATVDVLLGAMPVLSYSQTGTGDTKVRKLLSLSQTVDTATLARARADFGV